MKLIDADAYESGFLEGHIAGYLKAEKNYARPIGKWIHSSAKKYHVICSLCKYESVIWNANFCPNCGADMKGGADNDVQ